MTISIRNAIYESCAICREDFTEVQRADTKKVIELACHHFFHMQCLSSCFSQNEIEGKELSCDYCTQLWNPENEVPLFTYCTPLYKQKRQDSSFRDDLNNIIDQEIKKNFLEERVKYFSTIPYKKWPAETEEVGIGIYHSVNDKVFNLHLSKEYMQRAVVSYLSERIQNEELFEKYLTKLVLQYTYDRQILESVPFARNLRKDFAQLLQDNPVSSVEEILFLLEKAVKEMKRKDCFGKTASLMVDRFLFCRSALRTLPQEIKRWGKTSLKELPIEADNGIYVLDPDDLTKVYQIKNFQELFHPQSTGYMGKWSTWLTAIPIGILAIWIFSHSKKL